MRWEGKTNSASMMLIKEEHLNYNSVITRNRDELEPGNTLHNLQKSARQQHN